MASSALLPSVLVPASASAFLHSRALHVAGPTFPAAPLQFLLLRPSNFLVLPPIQPSPDRDRAKFDEEPGPEDAKVFDQVDVATRVEDYHQEGLFQAVKRHRV